MNRENIKKRVIQIAENTLGVTLDETESLKESGIDSLSLVMLVVAIEEDFKLAFDDDDLQPEALQSLTGLVSLVEKYL